MLGQGHKVSENQARVFQAGPGHRTFTNTFLPGLKRNAWNVALCFPVLDALVCAWESSAVLFNAAFFWPLIHILRSPPKSLSECDCGINGWEEAAARVIFFCVFTIYAQAGRGFLLDLSCTEAA